MREHPHLFLQIQSPVKDTNHANLFCSVENQITQFFCSIYPKCSSRATVMSASVDVTIGDIYLLIKSSKWNPITIKNSLHLWLNAL